LLGGRLDDDVAVAKAVIAAAGRDVAERRLLVRLGDLAAGELAVEVVLDPLAGAIERCRVEIVEPHLQPGKRADMGDTAPHLPGADDPDFLDHRHLPLASSASSSGTSLKRSPTRP